MSRVFEAISPGSFIGAMLQRFRSTILGLLVGFLITLAVSWSLAAFLPQRGWREQSFLNEFDLANLAIDRYTSFGSVRRVWTQSEPGVFLWYQFSTPIHAPIEADDFRPLDADALGWLAWGLSEQVRRDPDRFPDEGCEHATGWPLPAFWYLLSVRYTPGAATIETSGGFPLQSNQLTINTANRRVLPWQPIWLGLLINSVFWGVTAFVVARGFMFGRRALRLRRNRCPSCGYSSPASRRPDARSAAGKDRDTPVTHRHVPRR